MTNPIHLSEFVWDARYRDRDARPPETSIADTWRRVANAVASVEPDPPTWGERFYRILENFAFLPGGRILAGAGTSRQVTLFNCFVMGAIEDTITGIFDALKEGALTMQQGGGVGYDFSTLRPSGSRARTTGSIASGPVSFLAVWDAMCATILASGARRGAMMATLRCDHPDIEAFIDAKRERDVLSHFNLSVLVSDEFMRAARADGDWPLVFPANLAQAAARPTARFLQRAWSGETHAVPCVVHRVIRARGLWERLCAAGYDSAEPGILFIDRINSANNLAYCETLSATNPCGEVPLPAYGGCNLGSINLTTFVREAFTPAASLDLAGIGETARIATRFLDDVISVSRFPLPQQRETVLRSRRIGLGITGLADALAMMGLRYDAPRAREVAAAAMQTMREAACGSSVQLARERGAFPAFHSRLFLERPQIRSLPEELRAAIRSAGIRNSHLTAIAPAGTISLLARNVSSGIEPIFGIEAMRRILDSAGLSHSFHTTDWAYARWRSMQTGELRIPPFFADCASISARDQLLMMAALQPHVDGAISKTVTLPADVPAGAVSEIYNTAWDMALKGCTVYRPAARTGVLADRHEPAVGREVSRGTHCCIAERESD